MSDFVKECPECGSEELSWKHSHETNSGVVDGRLRMHDIHTVFFLGCENCSNTVSTLSADEITAYLDAMHRLVSEMEIKS